MTPRSRWLLRAAAAAVVAVVELVLLVPSHPESGVLHLLVGMLPSGGRSAWIAFWVIESLGNIALFVPVGIILGLLLRPRWALVLTVLLSAASEIAQIWIPSRHASVSDVVLNAIGGAAGVAVAVGVLRLAERLRRTASRRPRSLQTR